MKSIDSINLNIFYFLLFFTAGCSTVTVTPVNTNSVTEGKVYHLPKPVLEVKPETDGTMTVTPQYIQDPEKAYAIKVSSQMSKVDTIIDVNENGFLEKFHWTSDTTAVPNEISSLIQDVVTKKIELEKEAKKKEDEDAKAKKKEAETDLSTAKSVLNTAQSNEKTALSNYQTAEDAVTKLEGDRKVLELEMSFLEVDLDKAETDEDKAKVQQQINSKEVEIKQNEEALSLAKIKRDRAKLEWQDSISKTAEAQTEVDQLEVTLVNLNAAMNDSSRNQQNNKKYQGPVYYEIREGLAADGFTKGQPDTYKPVLYLAAIKFPGKSEDESNELISQLEFKTNQYIATQSPSEEGPKKVSIRNKTPLVISQIKKRETVLSAALARDIAQKKYENEPADSKQKLALKNLFDQAKLTYKNIYEQEKERGYVIEFIFGVDVSNPTAQKVVPDAPGPQVGGQGGDVIEGSMEGGGGVDDSVDLPTYHIDARTVAVYLSGDTKTGKHELKVQAKKVYPVKFEYFIKQ